jgi:hypothetical protein
VLGAWTPPTEGMPSATGESAVSRTIGKSNMTFAEPQDEVVAWRMVVAQEPEKLHQVLSYRDGCTASVPNTGSLDVHH